jgi:hypothetical protein
VDDNNIFELILEEGNDKDLIHVESKRIYVRDRIATASNVWVCLFI